MGRPAGGAPGGHRSHGLGGCRSLGDVLIRGPTAALWTIGHSTLSLERFAERLREAGIRGLADVRRFPASRRHPQFERHAMEESLPAAGVVYRWFEALGGRRSPGAVATERNAGLRVRGFRAYADYALTQPFREALDDLVAWAVQVPVAICCAEGMWWQCHRRIVADQLVARGHSVVHLLPGGGAAEHALWDLARVTPQGPVYPAPQADVFEAAGRDPVP